MRRWLPLIIVCVLGIGGAAQAQDQAEDLRDFCAQRPGRATPPCILDAGHLQLEVGIADGTFDRHGPSHEEVEVYAAPELRYGLTRRLELEASAQPAIVDRVGGEGRTTGVGDTTLGLMGALTDPDAKDGAAVSLLGFVNAPTATHGLGAGGWSGGAKLAADIPLTEKVSLGLTPEIDVLRDAAGGGTHLAYTMVGGLSRSFGPVSLGAELWGQVEEEPQGETRQATFDLTAAVTAGEAMQWDAGLAAGLNREAPNLEIYLGLARRF